MNLLIVVHLFLNMNAKILIFVISVQNSVNSNFVLRISTKHFSRNKIYCALDRSRFAYLFLSHSFRTRDPKKKGRERGKKISSITFLPMISIFDYEPLNSSSRGKKDDGSILIAYATRFSLSNHSRNHAKSCVINR